MVQKNRPNWVREQAECDAKLVFKNLIREVESDVEEMKTYLPTLRPKYTFQIERSCNQMGIVYKSTVTDKESTVTFSLNKSDQSIRVDVQGTEHRRYMLQPLWNQREERCVLLLDDAPLEMWEVCKKIFEPLFFQEK